MAPPKGKRQIRLGALTFTLMVERLMSQPCTAYELAASTGLHYLTTIRTLRLMHEHGVIHVRAWVRNCDNRYIIRKWALGRGTDAERPKRDRSRKKPQPKTMTRWVTPTPWQQEAH